MERDKMQDFAVQVMYNTTKAIAERRPRFSVAHEGVLYMLEIPHDKLPQEGEPHLMCGACGFWIPGPPIDRPAHQHGRASLTA